MDTMTKTQIKNEFIDSCKRYMSEERLSNALKWCAKNPKESEVLAIMLSTNQKIPLHLIKEYTDILSWDRMAMHQKLSEELMEENKEKFNWGNVGLRQTLSNEFIIRHSDKLDSRSVSTYQVLTENTMNLLTDYLDWFSLSSSQKFSKSFLLENVDKLSLHMVNMNIKLNYDVRLVAKELMEFRDKF